MSVWGKLASRYEGKENQKHRMLALDGGGIRGVLTLEVLARMEEILAEATDSGPNFKLCHFFDYVGGTSTGAIIAAGIARGMSAKELLDFYFNTGPFMFDKQYILKRWHNLYKSDPLKQELQITFGAQTTLKPDDLECLLLAVVRNRTMDSPWPISSNPQAKYNNTSRPDCNLNLPLWQIVRASAESPVFFPPEVVHWDPADELKAFVFSDGSLTPYNNPAFLLFRAATEPSYRLNWASGEDQLLIISVGTGASTIVDDELSDSNQGSIDHVSAVPSSLIYAAMVDQDTNCRFIGRCVHGAVLDRETGDMIPRADDGSRIPLNHDLGRKFLYARYNADLSRQGLDAIGLHDIKPTNVQKLDSALHIDDLRTIGRKAAEEIKIEHFGDFIS